ncbi:MAG: hypothetical protein OEY67_10545 [Gammaproteobacteria bacterium]|nr:hypothetical protein [Gammaproteobacteria bacterium]
MKKLKYALLGIFLSVFGSVSYAENLYPGTVTIANNIDTQVLTAWFSVGHSAYNTNGSYVHTLLTDQYIMVSAKTSDSGNTFVCFSYPTDPYFQSWRALLASAGNGTAIRAFKLASSNRCGYINSYKRSEYLK